jgi:hypothetical protein
VYAYSKRSSSDCLRFLSSSKKKLKHDYGPYDRYHEPDEPIDIGHDLTPLRVVSYLSPMSGSSYLEGSSGKQYRKQRHKDAHNQRYPGDDPRHRFALLVGGAETLSR